MFPSAQRHRAATFMLRQKVRCGQRRGTHERAGNPIRASLQRSPRGSEVRPGRCAYAQLQVQGA
jgi:hypothetical protein